MQYGRHNQQSHKRISLSGGQMTPQCLLLEKLTLRNCTHWNRCHGKTVPPEWCHKAELLPASSLPASLSSWHPLLVVKNKVWPPDIIWGDADFFYATVVIWIPSEVDVCPLLKREDFSPWEPRPTLGLEYFSETVPPLLWDMQVRINIWEWDPQIIFYINL